MCGINGIVRESRSFSLKEDIIKMNNSIIHRGPDDEGVYLFEGRLALGMRRLSIIDLTTGKQPILNKKKDKIIVFNGEIYNYKILQSDLQNLGYQFTTSSDTEVILALYEFYGESCVKFLNGMFSFSIYDKSKDIVFIARDRFGEKPLYYSTTNDQFIWSSELKSIVLLNPSLKKVSKTSLEIYFSLSYIPAPYTIYENIFKLEPSTTLTLNTLTLEYTTNKYWEFKNENSFNLDFSNYDKLKIKVRNLLTDSIEKRMVSDVPIGVFLSGGIDSAIVASVMSKISGSKIKSFTVGYQNKRYDESSRANKIAHYINSEHFDCLLNFNQLITQIDEIILNYDEPFADSSALPTYFVSKHTSNFVKVALTGDGGDEVFGGYNKYLLYSVGKNVYSFFHLQLLKSFTVCNLFKNLDSKSGIVKLKKFIECLDESTIQSHLNIIQLGFRNNEVNNILTNTGLYGIKKILLSIIDSMPQSFNSDFQFIRYIDFKISLEGDMLPKVDRASMLSSLECRAPFLDHRLVDLSFNLPDNYLIRGFNRKRILKDAFEYAVPKNYFNSPKNGFEIPIGSWLRNELKSDLIKCLSKEFLDVHGLINKNFVSTLMNEHFSGSYDHSNKLWIIYCFQKWYLKNII